MIVVMVDLPMSMTIVCVPGVRGCRSATQPCPTDRPCVPGGRPKMLSAGRTMRSRLDLGHRHGLAVDGDRGRNLHIVLARTDPQLGFSGAEPRVVPVERAALKRVRCNEDFRAGLYGARLGAGGPQRRNRAAEVEARESGTAAAEGVLGARCLKHLRPQRPEGVIELLRRDGAGRRCGHAERQRGEYQDPNEAQHGASHPSVAPRALAPRMSLHAGLAD
jgi:hypothetical protein